jgi:hypothetical protein
VSPSRRRTLVVIAVATLVGVGAGVVIGLAEDDEPEPGAGSAPPATSTTAEQPAEDPQAGSNGGGGGGEDEPQLPPEEEDPQGAEPGPSGPAPETTDERAAASAARGYVQALDRRAGAAVCATFAPRALDGIEFPVERSSCPATVEASLGFKRRGFPVWESSEMTDAVSAEVNGETARVVATIFTVYADVREPTIEDDIIYLRRSGDRWQIAKPSLTLHRAIGDADPPPSALSPPGG